MNKLIITGRLTRDSELRRISSGTAVLNFSVANNTGYGDNVKTHYFDCALFGKRAEGRLSEFLVKGKQVAVEGEISLNTYEKKSGGTGASLNVFVQNVELMGGVKPTTESTQNTASQANEDFNDDIPF